ncbi:interferon epsilon isoform X2 [Trachypithecus francoisi]|uniref:interferon epsilon isoform X2 n=1 Tax=Trachypithecus francoisi TaxID=54180 RepID=UPI00141A67A3|nr:interferon epsilon isoform X2 [Trachypithecus francoisi]
MGRRCGNVHSRASLVGARARELERPPRRSFVSSCDLRITWSAARGAQVPRPAPGEKRRASPAPAPELAGGPPGPGPDLGGGVPRAAWSGVLGAGSGPCECAWARPGGASDLLLGPSGRNGFPEIPPQGQCRALNHSHPQLLLLPSPAPSSRSPGVPAADEVQCGAGPGRSCSMQQRSAPCKKLKTCCSTS